jgi:hypothetical protein
VSDERDDFDDLFGSIFDFFTEDASAWRKLERLRARVRELQAENAALRRALSPQLPLSPPDAPPHARAPGPRGDTWAAKPLKEEDE